MLRPWQAGLSRRTAMAGTLALSAAPALGRETKDGSAPAKARGEKAPWLSFPSPLPKLPAATRSEVAALNGVKLFFAQFGQGEPVLFLHGGMGNSTHWARQVEHLKDRYLVTLMDTRGHGRSPVTSNSYGFSVFAKDVEALLDHLGIRETAVVGWSDGGITGLQLAMLPSRRVSRLFAFGANATPDGLIPGGSKKPAFAKYVAQCRASYPDPKRWPDLVSGLGAMWKREPNFSKEQLAAIKVRTTVAFADHDEIIRPEHAKFIAGTIPGGRLAPLTKVSHFAMLQDPAAFNAALDTFLTG